MSQAIAEFLGTFAIVFFGCGSVGIFGLHSPDSMVMVPIMFGGIVAVMVYTIGHLSGAHMNPAVTLAFACVRHFPIRQIPMYVLMQCLGAIAACLSLLYLIPGIETLAPTIPIVSPLKAILIEALLSFFLMFVVMGVATDTRAIGTMAGAAIGVVVAMDAYVGGALTGASMNPARSLGPAIFEEGGLACMYIYVIGPCLGTVTAGFTYRYIKCHSLPGE
jgi:MIP family channel proteins